MNVTPYFIPDSPDQNPPNPTQDPPAPVSTIQSIAQPVLEQNTSHGRRRKEQESEETQPERRIARSDQTPPEVPSATTSKIQAVAKPFQEQSTPHVRPRDQQESDEIQPERKIARSASSKTCLEIIGELKIDFQAHPVERYKQFDHIFAQLAEKPFDQADIDILQQLLGNAAYMTFFFRYIYHRLSNAGKTALLAIVAKLLQFPEEPGIEELQRCWTLLPLMSSLLQENQPLELSTELEMDLVKALDVMQNKGELEDRTDPAFPFRPDPNFPFMSESKALAFKNCQRLAAFPLNRDTMLPILIALNLMHENEVKEFDRQAYDRLKEHLQNCPVTDLFECISLFPCEIQEESLLCVIVDTYIEKLPPKQQFGCLQLLVKLRRQPNANYTNIDFLFSWQYHQCLNRNPHLKPDAFPLFKHYCNTVLKSGQSYPQAIFSCFETLSHYFAVPSTEIQELFALWLGSYASSENTLVHYLNFFTCLSGLNPHYSLSREIQQTICNWVESISKLLERQLENSDAYRFVAIYGLLVLARFESSEQFCRLTTPLIKKNFLKLQLPIPEGDLFTSSQIYSYLLVALQPILENKREGLWEYPAVAFSHGDTFEESTLTTVYKILELLADAAERDVLPPLSYDANAIYSSLIHCWHHADDEDESGSVCFSCVGLLARLAACGRLPRLSDRACKELKELLKNAPCFALNILNILTFTQHPDLKEVLSEFHPKIVRQIVISSEFLKDLKNSKKTMIAYWTAIQCLANAGYLRNLSPKNSQDLRDHVCGTLKNLQQEPHRLSSRLALVIDHCLNALLEHHCLDRFPDDCPEEERKKLMLEIVTFHKQIRAKSAAALRSRAQTGRPI